MFLSLLNPPQQQAFVAALAMLAQADGGLHETETRLASSLKRELDIEIELSSPTDQPALEAQFAAAFSDAPASARAAIVELAGIAVIDGDAHEDELELLDTLAAASGVGDLDLAGVLEFAARARDLIVDGDRLVNTGTTGI